MTNAPSSNNQNSPRNNNDISQSLTQDSTVFKRREVRVGEKENSLVNILFHWDYGNIGNRVLTYLFSRDIKTLREVCTETCSMLTQKGFFDLKRALADTQNILPQEVPASTQQPLISQSVRKLVTIPTSDNELFNQVIKAVNDPTAQESILSKAPNINVKDKREFTLLHYACIGGDEELVKILIEKFRAKIDETNLDKQTGLHLTISNGHINIAKYLSERGADIFIKSSTGQNVLQYAAHHGESEFIRWLFEEHSNDYQRRKLIEAQDHDGKNALHYGAFCTEPAVIELLCKYGFNPNEKNNYGYTALHFAASRNENTLVMESLIKAGCDINAVNINGDTPLMLAINFKNVKVANYLSEFELKKYCGDVESTDERLEEYLQAAYEELCEGNCGKSIDSYAKALLLAERQDNKTILCYILIKLGDNYLSQNNHAQAAKFMASAFTLSLQEKLQHIFSEDYFCSKQLAIETKFIRDVCEDQSTIPVIDFMAYKKRLSAVRERTGTALKRGDKSVEEVLFDITKTSKDIASDLLRDCFQLVGKEPCEYAVLGLGSMSRNEMCPYSDVELAILVKEDSKKTKSYFNKVLRLLELKIISLTEAEFPILSRGLCSITKNGFCLDNGGNTPLGKEELIGTPLKLAVFQSHKNFGEDVILSNVLKSVCLIVGSERQKLVKDYQTAVQKILTARATAGITEFFTKSLKVGQEQALKLMKGDIAEFEPQLNKGSDNIFFNVKKELYRLPSSFISNLALFYNISESNSFKRLQLLKEKKAISEEGYQNLKRVMEFATRLRIKTHLHYQGEEENIYHREIIKEKNVSQSKREEVYEIDDRELRELAESFRVLFALHEAIKKFVKSDGRASLLPESFYSKESKYVEAQVHERSGNYKAAIKCYNEAYNLNPEDLSALLGLIRLKMHTHNFQDCELITERGLKASIQIYGKETHPEVIKFKYLLAKFYLTQENYEEASRVYIELMNTGRKESNYELVKDALQDLILISIKQRNYKEALKYIKEGIEVTKKAYGVKSLELGQMMERLGEVCKLQEKYEEAEQHHKEALNIYEGASEKHYAKIAKVLDGLGDINFDGYGEASRAQSYYIQALDLRNKEYGNTHPEIAISYMKFMNAYYSYGKYGKAVEYGEKALSIVIRFYGEQHPETVKIYEQLKNGYYGSFDNEKALDYASRILKSNISIYGNNHPKVWESYYELGNIYYACGDIEKAKEYYAKGLKGSGKDMSDKTVVSGLKSNYRKHNKLKRFLTGEECALINNYINLGIVRQPEIKTKELPKESLTKEKPIPGSKETDESKHKGKDIRHEQLLSYESLYEINESIALKELFDGGKESATGENKIASKVVVYGRAGIGKTTMCKYIVSRWQNGSLWQNKFEAIFWLPLRELIAYPEESFPTLFKIIQDKCIARGSIGEETIETFIQKNSSKVLFILDGYDEIAQMIESKECLKTLLAQVLKNKEWNVLVTSRPAQIERIGEQEIKFDRQLENIGFTNENIESYVKRFASDKSEGLIKFLKNNSSIWGIAHVPINLELICSIWGSSIEGKEAVEYTMTGLYSAIVNKLLERYLKKSRKVNVKALSSSEFQKETAVVTRVLEKLALKGMMSNQIIISESLVNEILEEEKGEREVLFNELLATGIVRIMDNASGLKDIHFIHLTFQEYYAARFIASSLEKGSGSDYRIAIKLMEEYKYTPYCEVMWWYVAGIVHSKYLENRESAGLKIFWKTIESAPRDLLGNVHVSLVIKCLDESKADSKIEILKEQLLKLSEWLCAKHKNNQMQRRLEISPYIRKSEIAMSSLMRELLTALRDQNRHRRGSAADELGRLDKVSSEIVNGLLNALRDKERFVVTSVADALVKLGKDNIEVISGLLDALRDENGYARPSAADALAKLGKDSPEVVSGLLTALSDWNSDVRQYSAMALGQLGKGSPEVVKGLLTALRDQDFGVRSYAAAALGQVGKGSPEVINGLLTALCDKGGSVRSFAAKALGQLGEGSSKVIKGLLAALHDQEDNYVRSSAATALGQLGKSSPEVISGLLTILTHYKEYVRSSAAAALGQLGKGNPEVVSGLLTILSDWDEAVRSSVADALVKLDKDSPEVVGGLLTALCDKKWPVRNTAAAALGQLGKDSPEVVNGLLTALTDKEWSVRDTAVAALEKLGKGSPEILRSLILTAFSDQNSNVKDRAAAALEKLGEGSPEVLRGLLLTALSDQDSNIRGKAAAVLGQLGKDNPEVVRGLLKALQDDDWYTRMCATCALEKLGKRSPEVVKGLLDVIHDENDFVKGHAVDALAKLGKDSLEAVSALLKALSDKEGPVRSTAARALGQLGRDSPEVISGLLAPLNDKDKDVRNSAVTALGQLGKSSPEVISGLLTALSDKERSVRSIAAAALGQLGKSSPEVVSGLLTALNDQGGGIPEVVMGFSIVLDKGGAIRSSAAAALGQLGKCSPEVIKGLLTALNDLDRDVRRSAAVALGQLGKCSSEVISGLLMALSDKKGFVNHSAAVALGELSTSSSEMISIAIAEVEDNNIINLLSDQLSITALIKCCAISGIHKWLQKLNNSKESCCLILQDHTLSINLQQKTQQIILTTDQICSLLNAFKNYANERKLSQLADVYDGYINAINYINFPHQSNN